MILDVGSYKSKYNAQSVVIKSTFYDIVEALLLILFIGVMGVKWMFRLRELLR